MQHASWLTVVDVFGALYNVILVCRVGLRGREDHDHVYTFTIRLEVQQD